MDHTEREPARQPSLPKMVTDVWYLKGFSDGYDARPMVIPRGLAGEQYKRGYAEGLAAAGRDVSGSDISR